MPSQLRRQTNSEISPYKYKYKGKHSSNKSAFVEEKEKEEIDEEIEECYSYDNFEEKSLSDHEE